VLMWRSQLSVDSRDQAETVLVSPPYTRSIAYLFVLALFLAVLSLSGVVPPLQSEDEVSHIERAYLLSKGDVILGTENGVTGGMIDSGLLKYASYFEAISIDYSNKVKSSDLAWTRKIGWGGAREFSNLPNTAVYFPLLYLPQAVAIGIGERADLSIDNTYRLARLFAQVASLSILLVALRLYPIPIVAIAIFVLPETLYQLCSASLDPISFSMTALVGALFLRAMDLEASFSDGMNLALAVSIFSLATSRLHLIGLLGLPFIIYRSRGAAHYWISGAVVLVASVAWIAIAFFSVHGVAVRSATTPEVLLFYMSHPGDFFGVIFRTLTDMAILSGYWITFVGLLGVWVDTPLDSVVYTLFAILLAWLAVQTLTCDMKRIMAAGNLSLLLCALLSVTVLAFIEIVAVTPHPANVVWGITGRYLAPTVVLLGFSVFNRQLSPTLTRVCWLVIYAMLVMSLWDVPPQLIKRYWLSG
jgi:uncharacterized membrane protein